MVLYSDESHGLHERFSGASQDDGRTLYQEFTWALDLLKAQNIFSVFLSTNSDLIHFAPSRVYWPSLRIHEMDAFQTPFTELPFDCHPSISGGNAIRSGTVTLAEVSTIGFMCMFGRALYVVMPVCS